MMLEAYGKENFTWINFRKDLFKLLQLYFFNPNYDALEKHRFL